MHKAITTTTTTNGSGGDEASRSSWKRAQRSGSVGGGRGEIHHHGHSVLIAAVALFLLHIATTTTPTAAAAGVSLVPVRSWIMEESNLRSWNEGLLLPNENGVVLGGRVVAAGLVCSPVPYDDPAQPFCVDPAVTSQPYAMAQSFYVLDIATPASAIPSNMVLLSRCIVALDGGNQFYFSGYLIATGPSACPQGTHNADLGYVSLARSTLFSQTVSTCASPFIYSTTGSCGSFGGYGASFFVVPINTTESRCTTFWCSSSSMCLASNVMVCDGVADCTAGEDESLETCCRGKICNSSATHQPQCLPTSKLCDGIVDCVGTGDETSCYAWTPIMHDVRLDSAGLTVSTVAGGYHDCVREAVRVSTTTFGFIEATSTCVIYGPDDAIVEHTIGDASLSSYMLYLASPGEVTYHQGTADSVTRNKCDAVVRCNGHGTADASTCLCVCDSGYYGPRCSQSLSMDDAYSFAVVCDTYYPLDGDLHHNILTVLSQGVLSDFFSVDVMQLSAEAMSFSTMQVVFVGALFPKAAGSQLVLWFKLKGASSQELNLCRSVIVTGGQNALLDLRIKTMLQVAYQAGGSSNPLLNNGRSYFQFIAPLTVPYTLSSITAATASTSTAGVWNVSIGYRVHQLQVYFFMGTSQAPATSDGTMFFPIDVTYYVAASSANGSSSTTSSAQVQCAPTMTYNYWSAALSRYCAQVYCVSDVLPDGPLRDVAYITFSSISSSDLCSSVLSPSVYAVPDLSGALPPLAALSSGEIHVTNGDFTRFLAAGVSTLCVAFVGIVIALVLFFVDERKLREKFPVSASVVDANDALHSIMQYFAATFSYYGKHKGSGSRVLSTSIFISLFAANVAFAGAFIIVYFAMSTSTMRSGDVLLELYYSNSTNSSEMSPMPFLAFRIPSEDDSAACRTRSVAGTPSYPPFMSAYCEDGGSTNASAPANIVFQAGRSKVACQASPSRSVAGGAVLQASTIFPGFSDSVYVRFSCGTPFEVKRRFDRLTQLQQSSVADLAISQSVYPEELSSARRQHWDIASSSSNQEGYDYHREFTGKLAKTTSSGACRFETARTAANASSMATSAIGNVQVVVQLSAEAFSENTTLNATDTLLATVTDVGNLSAEVLAHGPMDGDQPIGFGYRGDVNAGFAKYHGMRGSYVDIGRYFVGEKDGDGFTISAYVQASNTTKGFMYAAVDAREYGSTGLSVPLRQIENNIARGETQWYSARNNVYSALYIDAVSRSVHFIYAGTPNTSALSVDSLFGSNSSSSSASSSSLSAVQYVDIVWDIHAIGAEWMFNGAWHHLAVLLKAENGQVKAQLVVDGRTSASQHTWNQCVPRRPWVMADMDTRSHYPVMSSSQEVVWTAGALYVGLLSGGVAKLEFYPALRDTFELWLGSTPAIREFNAMDTTRYVVLGALLVAAGVIFLAVLLLTSGVELYQTHKTVNASLEESSAAQYKALWAQKPCDNDGNRYAVLPFAVARDWLEVDHMALDALLHELAKSSKDSPRELVRILYTQRKRSNNNNAETNKTKDEEAAASFEQQQPSATEWTVTLLAAGQSKVADEEEKQKLADDDDRDTAGIASSQQSTVVVNAQRSSRAQGDVVVDAGKLNFVSEQHVATQNGDTPLAASLASEIKQMLNPVIIALQSVYIWLTTLPIPSLYHLGFGSFFSFLCIDWTAALHSIPPVVTPLMQLFVGMVAVSLFYFALHRDEQRFAEYVGRYVLRREQLRATRKENDDQHQGDDDKQDGVVKPTSTTAATGITALDEIAANDDVALVELGCEYTFHITLLDLKQAQQVDQGLLLLDDDADTGDTNGQRNIETYNGNTLRVVGETVDGDVELEPVVIGVDDDVNAVVALVTAGEGPSKADCQISDEARGSMMPQEEQAQSSSPVIMHKLGGCCVRHERRRMHSVIQTDVFPFTSRAECCVIQNGSRCGCSVGRMYVCGASYIDDAGDPRVCSYSLCQLHYRGNVVDGLLADALAVTRGIAENGLMWIFASAALFIANTLYTPFLKAALMIVACHPYMQCLFPQCWDSPDRNFALGAYLSLVLIVFFGVGFPLSLTMLLHRRLRLLKSAFFAPEFDGAYGSGVSTVLLDEWQRFSMTDPTALGTLYKSFELQWLFVPPMLCAWKIILLVPPVFLESGTFQQSAAVAAAEFSYGVFLFVTEPAIAPIVDIMYKVGVAHQMLFLGVQNIGMHYRYLGLGNMSGPMMALTGLYLVFCVFCIVWSKVAPAVTEARRVARVQKILATFNMPYSAATTLYVAPGTTTHHTDMMPTTTTEEEGRRRRGSNFARHPLATSSTPVLPFAAGEDGVA